MAAAGRQSTRTQAWNRLACSMRVLVWARASLGYRGARARVGRGPKGRGKESVMVGAYAPPGAVFPRT